jgi:hypothetical protein
MAEIVKLTGAEILIAHHVAAMRQVQSIKSGIEHKFGAVRQGNEWMDTLGCFGELAVAKALNLFWVGTIGAYNKKDVGGLVEVRTMQKAHHNLILHPEDDDNDPFVLCYYASAQSIALVGWLFACDGKRPEYWKDPVGGRPAFFVPSSMLRPISELREWVRDNRTEVASFEMEETA